MIRGAQVGVESGLQSESVMSREAWAWCVGSNAQSQNVEVVTGTPAGRHNRRVGSEERAPALAPFRLIVLPTLTRRPLLSLPLLLVLVVLSAFSDRCKAAICCGWMVACHRRPCQVWRADAKRRRVRLAELSHVVRRLKQRVRWSPPVINSPMVSILPRFAAAAAA